MWDLSFLTRDQTCIGRQSLNRWTAVIVPVLVFLSVNESFKNGYGCANVFNLT